MPGQETDLLFERLHFPQDFLCGPRSMTEVSTRDGSTGNSGRDQLLTLGLRGVESVWASRAAFPSR